MDQKRRYRVLRGRDVDLRTAEAWVRASRIMSHDIEIFDREVIRRKRGRSRTRERRLENMMPGYGFWEVPTDEDRIRGHESLLKMIGERFGVRMMRDTENVKAEVRWDELEGMRRLREESRVMTRRTMKRKFEIGDLVRVMEGVMRDATGIVSDVRIDVIQIDVLRPVEMRGWFPLIVSDGNVELVKG